MSSESLMKQSTNGQIKSDIAEQKMLMASRISLTDIQAAIFFRQTLQK
jgi:hypothetical protein